MGERERDKIEIHSRIMRWRYRKRKIEKVSVCLKDWEKKREIPCVYMYVRLYV